MSFLDFAKQKSRLLLLGVIVASALAVGFTYTAVFVFNPSGGSLSPYLVGYYDLRTEECVGKDRSDPLLGTACADKTVDGIRNDSTEAGIDLMNPTTNRLLALVAIYNEAGTNVACGVETVEANETRRVFVNDRLLSGIGDGQFGAIKVVTLLDADRTRVQAGLKGWLNHFVRETSLRDDGDGASRQIDQIFFRQTRLQEVPVAVLKANKNAELLAITGACAGGF